MRADQIPNAKSRRQHRLSAFGRPEQKTLHNILKRELVYNFGYEDKLAIAALLVERFLALFEEYAPAPERLQPVSCSGWPWLCRRRRYVVRAWPSRKCGPSS